MSDYFTKEFRNRRGERLDTAYHEGEREDVLLLMAHGVTGNKDRPLLVKLAKEMSGRGWPCLRLSYSGNGDSEGRFEDATVTKEVEDLQDVLDQLPDTVKIIYMGHSMGGAVGVKVAAKSTRIWALVSLAGMVKTADFVAREFADVTPGSGFMWDDETCPLSQQFVDDLNGIGDVLSDVQQLRVPYLLVHGEADDVVPISDSEEAMEAARTAVEMVRFPEASHSFEEVEAEALADEIEQWLEEW